MLGRGDGAMRKMVELLLLQIDPLVSCQLQLLASTRCEVSPSRS